MVSTGMPVTHGKPGTVHPSLPSHTVMSGGVTFHLLDVSQQLEINTPQDEGWRNNGPNMTTRKVEHVKLHPTMKGMLPV